jgi:hypothetical protein
MSEIFSPTEIPFEPLTLDDDSNKHGSIYFNNCLATDIKQQEEVPEYIAVGRRRNSIIVMRDHFSFPYRFEMEKEAENYQIFNADSYQPNEARKRRKREESCGFGFSELMKDTKGKFKVKMERTDQDIVIHSKKAKKSDVNDKSEEATEQGENKNVNDLLGNKRPNMVTTEEHRLGIKIKKVKQYWSKSTLLIPNALLVTTKFKDDDNNLLEFQDYSGKSVLAQSYSQKNKLKKAKVKEEPQEEENLMNLAKKRSFRLILDCLDDPDVTGLF